LKFSDADLLISDKDQILPNLDQANAFGSAGYWCQRSVRSSLHHIANMLKSILFLQFKTLDVTDKAAIKVSLKNISPILYQCSCIYCG
jgi:hypothetical protein